LSGRNQIEAENTLFSGKEPGRQKVFAVLRTSIALKTAGGRQAATTKSKVAQSRRSKSKRDASASKS
jgi:hypothetical protein